MKSRNVHSRGDLGHRGLDRAIAERSAKNLPLQVGADSAKAGIDPIPTAVVEKALIAIEGADLRFPTPSGRRRSVPRSQ